MRRAALVILVALAGCPAWRSRAEVEDPVDGLLRRADAAWAQRLDEGYQPARELLREAHGLGARDPRALWRLARLEVEQGMAAEGRDQARSAYGLARSVGMECLETDPVFAQRRVEVGWEGALEALDPSLATCQLWTTVAWVRWAELMGGEAASLDLPVVHLFVSRAAGPWEPAPTAWTVQSAHLVPWSEGVLAATRPRAEGQDLELARARLLDAAATGAGELMVHADLLRLVAWPTQDVVLVASQEEAIRRAEIDTPADRRAVEWLDELRESEEHGGSD